MDDLRHIIVNSGLGVKTIAITPKSTWGDLKASYDRPYLIFNTIVLLNGELVKHTNHDLVNLPNGANVQLRFYRTCADCKKFFQCDFMLKQCADCRI